MVDKDKCRKRKKITYYERRGESSRPSAREIFKPPINIPFILLLLPVAEYSCDPLNAAAVRAALACGARKNTTDCDSRASNGGFQPSREPGHDQSCIKPDGNSRTDILRILRTQRRPSNFGSSIVAARPLLRTNGSWVESAAGLICHVLHRA